MWSYLSDYVCVAIYLTIILCKDMGDYECVVIFVGLCCYIVDYDYMVIWVTMWSRLVFLPQYNGQACRISLLD